MVKYESQTLEQLKSRYVAALKKIYSPSDIATGNFPANHREHVFDCEDGIRLIVSFDLLGDLPVLHFSCSIDFELWNKVYANVQMDAGKIRDMMVKRWREISGDKESAAVYLPTASTRASHFFVEVKEEV